MPFYDYECAACRHTFELFQKISDPAEAVCPKCGGAKAKRLISQTSFALKGGGWYKDGYTDSATKDRKVDTGGAGESTPAPSAPSTPSPSPPPKTEGKTNSPPKPNSGN